MVVILGAEIPRYDGLFAHFVARGKLKEGLDVKRLLHCAIARCPFSLYELMRIVPRMSAFLMTLEADCDMTRTRFAILVFPQDSRLGVMLFYAQVN